MRLILYRVLVKDSDAFVAAASELPGVQSASSRRRGQLVECDDSITEEQLQNLDAAVKPCVESVVEGDGPGRARAIPAEDDRTKNVSS